jgi:Fic family protein
MESYMPKLLPEAYGELNYTFFMDELIDATVAFEVYVEKLKDSKVDSSVFLPTLSQKEALASSLMEGTQATLDGVLLNQVTPNDNDKNLKEIVNYQSASAIGYALLKRGEFDHDLFYSIHKELLSGNVRKNTQTIGKYRTTQNYIGKNTGELIYTPPAADKIMPLMDNLIKYINTDNDKIRHLVRIAIIHAQFETIHPFGDGNGRVGRILIPLYLYAKGLLPSPFFFLSEALERDKHKYYRLLMDTREPHRWNEWIKFFLETVSKQCRKYIAIFDQINALYEKTRKQTCDLFKSSSVVPIVDAMFKYPVIDSKTMQKETKISLATINRYLNILSENGILYSDGKQRNRHFFFYDLLGLMRD